LFAFFAQIVYMERVMGRSGGQRVRPHGSSPKLLNGFRLNLVLCLLISDDHIGISHSTLYNLCSWNTVV